MRVLLWRSTGLTAREIAKIRLAMLEEPSVEVLDIACALPGALRRSSGLLRSITLDPRRLFASMSAVRGSCIGIF